MRKNYKKTTGLRFSLVKWTLTGFFCSVGVFLILYLFLTRCIASRADAYSVFHDYVVNEELPALRQFRVFVRDNEISAFEDEGNRTYQLVYEWLKDQKYQQITISSHGVIELYINNYKHIFNLFKLPTVYAFDNADFSRPITFEDGTAYVYINTGAASRFYLYVICFCLLASVFISLLVIFIFMSKLVKRIVLLDRDVSGIDYEKLTVPIKSPGNDELAHLAQEVDKARLRLLEAQQRERSVNEAHNNFIRGIAHDLRTPMTSVLSYISLAKDADDEEKGLLLDQADHKMHALSSMTNEMFDYMTLETQKETELSPPESLSSAFGDSMSELIMFLREDGFDIDMCEPDMPPGQVSVNHIYIGRIVDNLLSNIEKYAEPGSAVGISIKAENDNAVITLQNRIAYKETSNHGTMLGLKNIGQMMRLMHGRIETIENFDDMVYTARIIFPLTGLEV